MTTTRAVHQDDAALLLRLQHAHQQVVVGRPDTTLDDVRDMLTDPDLVPASPVVLDDDGTPLGVALVFPDGDSDHVVVDVVVDPVRGADLLDGLLRQALALARDVGAARGRAQLEVDQGCYRQDAQLADALRALEFAPATVFHRMRRDLDAAVEVRVPEGVVLACVADDDQAVLRRAHRLHSSTFAGHFGFVARPWEDWLAAHRARSGTGPLWFASVGGVDVGFLHESDQFLEDEQAGYVARLGVERSHRGRGIARALLLSSFARMRERGRVAALLHVDSANDTGATALYESVGMTPVVVIDVWRRALPVVG